MIYDSELVTEVNSAIYHQCKKRGYAAPAYVLPNNRCAVKRKI